VRGKGGGKVGGVWKEGSQVAYNEQDRFGEKLGGIFSFSVGGEYFLWKNFIPLSGPGGKKSSIFFGEMLGGRKLSTVPEEGNPSWVRCYDLASPKRGF